MEQLLEIFPGAEELTLGTTRRICVLNDVVVVVSYQGLAEAYKCDAEGMEVGAPIKSKTTKMPHNRFYCCTNCGYESSGMEEFTIREHLGRFHEVEMPMSKYT